MIRLKICIVFTMSVFRNTIIDSIRMHIHKECIAEGNSNQTTYKWHNTSSFNFMKSVFIKHR